MSHGIMFLLILIFIYAFVVIVTKITTIVFRFIGKVVGSIVNGICSVIGWCISTAWKIVTAPIHILWGLFLDR